MLFLYSCKLLVQMSILLYMPIVSALFYQVPKVSGFEYR